MSDLGKRRKRNLVHIAGLSLLAVALAVGVREAKAQAPACVGDCNLSGAVTVDDIITMVNIALGSAPIDACQVPCPDSPLEVVVSCIIEAVNNSLAGCPVAPTNTPMDDATSTPTNTPLAPLTPTPTATGGQGPTPQPGGAGLVSAITGVVIAGDGSIVATFSLTDAEGTPLTPTLSSTQDPNMARTRFAIAHVEDYSGGGEFNNPFSRYVNDVNATRPAYDSGGTLAAIDAAAGVYRYTFKTKLPADFDPTRTYTVGMQVDRTYQAQQLSANPIFDLVPAGGTPQIREGVTTAQCNTCHNPLIAHGNRREVRLCLLCHAEAATDANGGRQETYQEFKLNRWTS